MNKHRTLFLRNEEDGSPGGGTAPPAPAPSPAANEGAAASVTVDDIKNVVGSMMSELRNGIFADLRKAGALKQDKTQDEKPRQSAPKEAPPAPAPTFSMEDVQRLLDIRDVSNRMRNERKATDAQIARFEKSLQYEKPENILSYATTWFDDLGIGKAETNQQGQAPAPKLVATPAPISDKGSPAPGGVHDWQRELAENPVGMSDANWRRMVAELGEVEARRKRIEAARSSPQANMRVTRPMG